MKMAKTNARSAVLFGVKDQRALIEDERSWTECGWTEVNSVGLDKDESAFLGMLASSDQLGQRAELGLEHGHAFGQVDQHGHRLGVHANVVLTDLSLDGLVGAVNGAAVRSVAVIVARLARELVGRYLVSSFALAQGHAEGHHVRFATHLAFHVHVNLVGALLAGLSDCVGAHLWSFGVLEEESAGSHFLVVIMIQILAFAENLLALNALFNQSLSLLTERVDGKVLSGQGVSSIVQHPHSSFIATLTSHRNVLYIARQRRQNG